MATFLFDEIIFGPVKSRRFGVSLGINLLPAGFKSCTLNCIYCECGWTHKNTTGMHKLPARDVIRKMLIQKLKDMLAEGKAPNNITFAGNGEPTIHPDFAEIIDDTIGIRNQFFPNTEISVLSNATLLYRKEVFEALDKVENNVLKLDTANEQTFRLLNQPCYEMPLNIIIDHIKKFNGRQIIQSLFVRGNHNGIIIDNTTDSEVAGWLEVIKDIAPRYVMVYPIARDAPVTGLERISKSELDRISLRVRSLGIKTKTYY